MASSQVFSSILDLFSPTRGPRVAFSEDLSASKSVRFLRRFRFRSGVDSLFGVYRAMWLRRCLESSFEEPSGIEVASKRPGAKCPRGFASDLERLRPSQHRPIVNLSQVFSESKRPRVTLSRPRSYLGSSVREPSGLEVASSQAFSSQAKNLLRFLELSSVMGKLGPK